MSFRFRIVLVVLVCVILVPIIAGWYALHHPDRFLPRITAYLQKRTGLHVGIRHMEASLFPVSVRVYGLEIKNPKPFPAGDFLKAPRLDAAVDLTSLLKGTISIRSLVLDHPVMDFISDPDGLWNFQNPSSSKQKPTRVSMGVISNVQIKDGVLLGSNLIDPADTPGPVTLEIRDFSAQLKQIDFHASSHGGPSQTIEGNLKAGSARFGSIRTTDLHSDLRITRARFTFKKFSAKTYRGRASGDFSFNSGGKVTTFETDLKVDGIGMPYLLAEFGKGPPKMTGMMQADLKLAGTIEHTPNPLAGIYGSGKITIRKGELPSLDRNKSMEQIKRFREAGTAALPCSAFSTFAGDMELRNHRMYSKRIGVDFYGIDVDGSGSTSVMGGGGMDYRGVATILKKQGFFTDMFAKVFKGAKEKEGRLTFPIRLAGTLTKPQFSVK